jgi:hypothetical protein
MLRKYPGTSRCCLVLVILLCGSATAVAEEKVSVCVIAILAGEGEEKVDDPRLVCIAREVKKLNPKLTRLRLGNMSCGSLPVGARDDFKLVEDEVASVVIQQAADKDNRIQLKVTPPKMGEITYMTACGKFLPILTPYRTKKDEVLIIGIRVQPCQGK